MSFAKSVRSPINVIAGALLAVCLYSIYFSINNVNIWAMLTAWGTTFAALAAIASAWTLYWQTHYTTSTQTLLQMLNAWQSPPMFPRMRQRSAQTLWEHANQQIPRTNRPALLLAASRETTIDLELDGDTSHVNSVLDFFEMIAFFVRNGVLDFEAAYQTFFWEMGCYWLLTQTFIRDVQQDEGTELWANYCWLMPQFVVRSGEPIAVWQAREFLMNEQSLTLDPTPRS